MKTLAYASTTRPNHLWSAAQFNSADPKNRTECDTPLVSRADAEAALAAKDAEIAKLRDALRSLVSATADFHEAAMEHLSDTTFDSDGILAEREAELSVVALPEARAAIAGGSDA